MVSPTAARCTCAHLRVYLALLPSGPDAVRRLRLHRVRAAVRPTRRRRRPPATQQCTRAHARGNVLEGAGSLEPGSDGLNVRSRANEAILSTGSGSRGQVQMGLPAYARYVRARS